MDGTLVTSERNKNETFETGNVKGREQLDVSVKWCGNVNWIELPLDRIQWWDVLERVMKL